jgi:hypothetical protein
MDGPRMEAVKTTLGLLLEALVDGDIITIISYESVARVLANAVMVDATSRGTLRAVTDGLHADGGTNLEAAFVALREVAQTPGTAPVDAAFIMTDGHINQGLTSASGLTRLLTAAVPAGTPVYTLGFGADHNSRMLRDMALRTRGSYTYADAAELIPATIADIISGLATEIGRGSILTIPEGWRSLEITAELGSAMFPVGVLVADKEQWVVLEGPAGPLVDVPPLVFTWRSSDGTTHTENCTTYNDFDALLVSEQWARCRVATVQTSIQEMLEANRIEDARAALTELGAELDASRAKDRTFVISLRAQVDEMLEALAPTNLPPMWPGGLVRQVASPGGAWMPPAPPMLAPILSRMASNTAALGIQRGVLSHLSSADPTAAPALRGGSGGRAGHSGVVHTFSSPSQRTASNTMAARYSQMTSVATDPDESEETLAAVIESVIEASDPSMMPTAHPRLLRANTVTPPPRSSTPVVSPTN